MPTGFEWPLYMGRPLAFLAQIDCAEASGLDGGARLPKSGRLLFFYDQTQSTWGFDPKDRGSWRVILADGDESSFGPALRPYGLELVYPEMTVQLEALLSLAPLPLHQIWEMTDEDYEGYREARDAAYSGGPTHQLFGSAVALRDDDMEIVCQLASNGVFYGYGCPPNSELLERVSEWKLLLQTDSDIDVEFMWGDVGRLYFWIRESDLANKNFDDVWMVLQCA